MTQNRTKEHQALVQAIRLELGREDDLVLWPNSTAKVLVVQSHAVKKVQRGEPIDPRRDLRWLNFGLCEGSSDIVGILECGTIERQTSETTFSIENCGRFVALEVKTPEKSKTARGGRLTKAQTMFLGLVRARGGFAAVVRSPQEARAAIARARAGAAE